MNRPHPVPWHLLYIFEFLGGMAFSAVGAAIPDIADSFSLTRTTVSSLPLAQFTGASAGILLAGFSLPRCRPVILLASAGTCMAAAAFVIGVLRSYSWSLLSGFFAVGAAMGVMFALPGSITPHLSGNSTARHMNTVYSFMSAGVVVSPVVSGVLLNAGHHYPSVFFIISGLGLAAALGALPFRFPKIDFGGGFTLGTMRELFGIHRAVSATLIAMGFCYMAAEAVPSNWIPKYLTDLPSGYSLLKTRVVLSIFWVAVTLGRHLCAAVLKTWNNPRVVITVLSLLAAACLLLVPLFAPAGGAPYIFAFSGLAFSGIIPVIFSFIDLLPKRLASIAFILIISIGTFGASGMGKAVGPIADALGFNAGIMIGAAPLVAVVALMMRLPRKKTKQFHCL